MELFAAVSVRPVAAAAIFSFSTHFKICFYYLSVFKFSLPLLRESADYVAPAARSFHLLTVLFFSETLLRNGKCFPRTNTVVSLACRLKFLFQTAPLV